MPVKQSALYAIGATPKLVQSLQYYPENMQPGKKYPAFIFFPGRGETANDGPIDLLYKNGPFALIKTGWKPPFILIGVHSFNDFPTASEVAAALLGIYRISGIDTANLFGCGLSAGAQTWFKWACYTPNAKNFIRAMILMSSPALGALYTTFKDRLDPIPVYIFHGDNDNVCPLKNIEPMYKAMSIANKNTTLVVYKGGHGGWNAFFDPKTGVYDWALQFVVQPEAANTKVVETPPAPVPEPVNVLPMIKYIAADFTFVPGSYNLRPIFVYEGDKPATFTLPEPPIATPPFSFLFRNRTNQAVTFSKPLQKTSTETVAFLKAGTFEICFDGGKWHVVRYAVDNL